MPNSRCVCWALVSCPIRHMRQCRQYRLGDQSGGVAGVCGACCSCMPSSAKPLTALCRAAESCVRCGDGRCHGRRTSVGTPTRPCSASSSSKPASMHSSSCRPKATTLSAPRALATDLQLSVTICARCWRTVYAAARTSIGGSYRVTMSSPTAMSSHWLLSIGICCMHCVTCHAACLMGLFW